MHPFTAWLMSSQHTNVHTQDLRAEFARGLILHLPKDFDAFALRDTLMTWEFGLNSDRQWLQQAGHEAWIEYQVWVSNLAFGHYE